MAVVDCVELERVASGLDAVLSGEGVERTCPIAFTAHSEVAFVELAVLLFHAARPLVPLHPRWTDSEIERALALVPSARRIADRDVASLLESARRGPFAPPTIDERDLAAIVFTSGTSHLPKPVLLSRRAFIASARANAANLGWKADDRWLLSLPFAHVGGLSVLTRSALARKSIVVSANPLAAIAEHRVTLASFVPTQLYRLLESDRENRLSALRAILIGGAAFAASLRRECAERGVIALASYGLTETCSQIAAQSPRERGDRDSGRALEAVEMRVAGAGSDGNGRIEVRGPMLMSGYAQADPLDPSAYFQTGDLGSIDSLGRLSVIGRADDVIVTGGENVHPAEVEHALLSERGVRAALAFGISDEIWGELVAAALVLEPGTDPDRVVASASEMLAPFKRPRRVALVPELPLTPSGKPDRRRARVELDRCARAINR